jgi:hypothetical protein
LLHLLCLQPESLVAQGNLAVQFFHAAKLLQELKGLKRDIAEVNKGRAPRQS